jgi:tight adherence protein B
MVALVAVLGAGFGLGLAAAVTALIPTAPAPAASRPWSLDRLAARWADAGRQALIRAAVSVVVGVAVGVATRWPVGALLAGATAWVLPLVLGGDRHGREVLERTEAVAVWAEMLRDSLSAAAGLEQTILLTAPFAPAAIRAEVADLAASVRAGRRLSVALEDFTARVQDPTGRLVARALAQASRRQSRQLPELLSELARRARERANLQLRIAPGHAKIRTNARIIVAFTLAMAAGMVAFNRQFLRPYDTALGQAVLLAVGIIFAAGFTGLSRLARSGLEPVSAQPPLTMTTPSAGTPPLTQPNGKEPRP